jgi:hypothetical protein
VAFLIAQGGATLYKVDLTTGTATALTLPTGVTLSTTRRPKFAVLNQWVAMVNSPTRNLVIDPEGIVRVMVPRPPTVGPSVVAGGSTGLTGAYLYALSNVVLNSDGELLLESPLSPLSKSVTLANNDASLTDLEIAPDSITHRRLYRTVAGGSYPTLYKVMDVEGNVATAVLDNVSDTTLPLLPAMPSTLTSPPGTLPGMRFKNIVEWKSRFWGISDNPSLIDTVFATETNKVYAWPNQLVAYPTGQDEKGIIGFAVRKNQLGLLKRNGLWQISGTSGSTGIAITNTSVQQVANAPGSLSAETTKTVPGDRVLYLGRDGVYEWSDQGVQNISKDQVHPWFTTDTYFNRAQFVNAFARYNEKLNQYELHLAAAGSSNIDRWVSFNLTTRKWYGPHVTALFTPSSACDVVDGDGLPVTLIGGTDGVIYVGNQSTYRDGAATVIDMDCFGPFHSCDEPDVEHYWGQLSMLTKIEASGTLSVTPYVGGLDAAAQSAISHTLTTGREKLRRLGDGRLMRLRMRAEHRQCQRNHLRLRGRPGV